MCLGGCDQSMHGLLSELSERWVVEERHPKLTASANLLCHAVTPDMAAIDYDILLSHAWKDGERPQQIADALTAADLRI
jgi:hypothetical protein